jgi:hypothetical protein
MRRLPESLCFTPAFRGATAPCCLLSRSDRQYAAEEPRLFPLPQGGSRVQRETRVVLYVQAGGLTGRRHLDQLRSELMPVRFFALVTSASGILPLTT